jgi:Holliday junction resolvase RusA-like endonuclease
MLFIPVYGQPLPQMRMKACKIGGHIRIYDPQAKQKEEIRWRIRGLYKEEPVTIPIYVEILFYMPIPKHTSTVRKKDMINGKMHHMKRPDVDNLIKLILDCMTGIVYKDDSQICDIRAKKLYAESPATIIQISRMPDYTGGRHEAHL